MEGGCTCGEIRYCIDGDPVLSLICFCNACLSSFGCDGYPGMMIKDEDFKVSEGTPGKFARNSDSGRQVVLHFCSNCGTSLWGQTELGMVSIAAGILDEPNLFNPTKAVFTSQAPNWARIPHNLELE